jgi:putative membrane protein
MTRFRWQTVAGGLSLAVLLVAGIQAQQAPPPRTTEAAPERPTMISQRDLATILVLKNRGEVQLAEFVSERAQTSEVKQFAEHMIKDHSALADRLQRFAREVPKAETAKRDPRFAAKEPVRVPRDGAGADMLQLHQQLVNQHGQTLESILKEKEGLEFDKHYLHIALLQHYQQLDHLRVFREHTTGELRSAIEEGIDAVEQHIKDAKGIYAKFEKSESKR